MKAVIYHGPGNIGWEEVAKPTLAADTDAIIRVDATTICGTDLHIWKGDTPEVTDGTILGHEAIGTVESVGSGVKNVRPGDRVARCRASRRVEPVVFAEKAATDSVSVVEAGSWGTSSTGRRRSTCECPSPTPRRTRCRSERAMRRSSCWRTFCRLRSRSGS